VSIREEVKRLLENARVQSTNTDDRVRHSLLLESVVQQNMEYVHSRIDEASAEARKHGQCFTAYFCPRAFSARASTFAHPHILALISGRWYIVTPGPLAGVLGESAAGEAAALRAVGSHTAAARSLDTLEDAGPGRTNAGIARAGTALMKHIASTSTNIQL
jgi:hypothetical protein